MAFASKIVTVVPAVDATVAKIKCANAVMLANVELTVIAPLIKNAAMLANAQKIATIAAKITIAKITVEKITNN